MHRKLWTLGVVSLLLVLTFDTRGQVRAFRPVTDAMLEHPDAGDWLHWRRTLDGWAHSPLDQITTKNASRLQLVWGWTLAPGVSEPGPVVHDGVMYVPQASGIVHALDAATGDLLWEYKHTFERSPDVSLPSRLRSIAIAGDKVILATPNAHLVALDARTGKVLWDHTVADETLGYRYTSGPIVVRGTIIAGMTGCERYKNDVCFISAHDLQTGRELWRVSTIARPGEPGGDTWGDLPLTRRAGGDAWIPGSYDPQTNLVYWSVAQAKPWARLSRGTDGDALYTNSTLAIDPATGTVAWYHQFIPGETNDQDEVFESVLVDRGGRRSLYKMGKLGILWQVDRTNGAFVAAHDLGYQNLVNVDTTTGKAVYRPGRLPTAGVEFEFCPDIQGVRGWHAMSYDPATHALLIPIHPACQTATYFDHVEHENLDVPTVYGNNPRYNGYRGGPSHRHPKMPDAAGALIAMDVDTGRVRWQFPMHAAPSISTLTTAGGITVSGDADRNLYVHDTATGTALFHTRLPAPLDGSAITYAVGGRQYIAVSTRGSGRRPGNAIYVFALPDDLRSSASARTPRQAVR
ncbi:MAG TPA: PQQ-binding-like beta-propeller repeat protein [Vicinamibacterales bacterium]|nr:PQQ-binding-like beta-propeller repeat protein [Vicinamibacterales bacterium]